MPAAGFWIGTSSPPRHRASRASWSAGTPALKSGIKERGYRRLSTKLMRDKASEPVPQDDTFIDPDTGMSCRNGGGTSICVPPQGTVHHQNRHGLNCTRTATVSFCSIL